MRNQEPQKLPPLSISLLIILTILQNGTVQSRTLLHQDCPASSCGDVTDIRYPFRLTTDPLYCGDPDYQLSCLHNKTLFHFHSGSYYVKHISYDTRFIRLVDVNLSDSSCALPSSSLSDLDLTSDGRFQGRVSNTFTSFVRCRSEIDDRRYRLVPCLSGGGGDYVYVSYDNYVISGLKGSCEFISRVPTIYQAVMYPSYDSIFQLLREGFDLGWSIECRDCIAAGYSCTVKSWETPYSYECYGSATGFYVPELVSILVYAVWDILLAINLVARFILAPIVLIGFLVHKYRATKKTVIDKENTMPDRISLMSRRYSFSDIIEITSHFKDKLGQGGFGTVYKGLLPEGCLVAVKLLGNGNFSDDEFINEVSTIGRIRHANVIRLLGFCSEGSHHALIFEYMSNGSLAKHIFSSEAEIQPFSWEKLLQIALGTARGIEHLHIGCDECILHLDIKPHNVLLDHNFIPKVSDFGLMKFSRKEVVSTVKGTTGYIAPELISGNLGAASCKSDVYSFGMLLLELAGSRRNVYVNGDCSSNVYFPSWVYEHLKEGGNLELDNATESEAAIARKLCVVGLCCIQKLASDRPSMTEVVEILGGKIGDLQLPPNSLSFPRHIASRDPESDSSTELLISEAVEKSS